MFASGFYDFVLREKSDCNTLYICVCILEYNKALIPPLLYSSSFLPCSSPPLLLCPPRAPSFSNDLHQQLAMEGGLIPLLVHARDNLAINSAARQLELFLGGVLDGGGYGV